MKLLVCFIFVVMMMGAVSAQDPCDVESLKAQITGDSLEALQASVLDVNVQIGTCLGGGEVGSSRTQPVPMGEGLVVPTGMIRVVGVEKYDSSAEPEPGNSFYAVKLAYECTLADPNGLCEGATYLRDYVTADGEVLTTNVGIGRELFGVAEGYSGSTIEGYVYFQDGENVSNLGLLRLKNADEEYFFSLAR